MERVIDDLQTGYQVDNGRSDRKENADEHKEPAPDHLLTYFQISQFLVLLLEAPLGVLLASKSLGQQNTTHRERFLHHSSE